MAEIEIGLGKSGRRAYGFDDIAIVPSRRTRDPDDVDISWQLDAYKFELPMMGSAMDGAISPETAIEIGRLAQRADPPGKRETFRHEMSGYPFDAGDGVTGWEPGPGNHVEHGARQASLHPGHVRFSVEFDALQPRLLPEGQKTV